MNKVYKLVWSKVRNCYVAVSEIAKSRTKAPKSGVINRTVVAGVLACVLSCGAVLPVYADNYTAGGGSVVYSMTDGIAIGTGAKIGYTNSDGTTSSLGHDGAIAIGKNAHSYFSKDIAIGIDSNSYGQGSVALGRLAEAGTLENASSSSIAIGQAAKAKGSSAVAIGQSAAASEYTSVAIGDYAKASGKTSIAIGQNATGSKDNTIALGLSATASVGNSLALGYYTKSTAANSISLGYYANASAANSIALGANSVADVKDTVSVGSSTLKRRVMNVANGTDDNDAVNYNQLKPTIKSLSVSGRTITYTKVDGTIGTITTQDNDTHYTSHLYVGSGTAANAATTNGNTKLTLADNSTVREKVTVKGTGATTVTSDANGVITINSTNTTYSTGNATTAGIGKLYAESGTNTDGSMTQKAINTALGGKYNTSGGTLTGNVTISKSAPALVTKNTALTRGTAPTATNNNWFVQGQDSAAKNTGGLYKTVSTTNVSEMRLYDYPNKDNTSGGHYISIGHDADGNAFTYAPTPAASSNNTNIATTAFVKTEVRPTADGTFAKKANSTAANITALDTAAKNAIKGLSVSGKVITYTKGDGTTGTITTQDTNTTYSAFKGATADAAGGAGLVTAPAKGQQNYVLHGDGTWKADANTTYSAMTAAEATTGTATTARSITAKVLGDYVKSKTDDKIKGLSVNGRTITYTRGDGTTGTITVQDNDTQVVSNSSVTVNDNGTGNMELSINNVDVVNDKDIVNVGSSTVTGEKSTAFGSGSNVTGENSIAIGTGHQVSGNNSGAIGDLNIVNGDNSYAVGNNTTIAEGISDVFVLGNNVTATGTNSVILGTGSDGSLDNVVSVGSSSNKRRIVNVANGTSASDVATVGQTIALTAGTNIKIVADGTNSIGQNKYKISASVGDAKYRIYTNKSSYNPADTEYGYPGERIGTTYPFQWVPPLEGAVENDVNYNNTMSIGGSNEFNGTSYSDNYLAVNQNKTNTYRTLAVGNGNYLGDRNSVAVGHENILPGESTVAIGNEIKPDNTVAYTVAVGTKVKATAENSQVVGRTGTKYQNAVISHNNALIGFGAETHASHDTAIGAFSNVQQDNSVAIGAFSVADEPNTVSVGRSASSAGFVNDYGSNYGPIYSGEIQRRITNVAYGENPTDAVNVEQLNEAVANAGKTYTAGNGIAVSSANAISAKAGTNVTVNSNGINVVGGATVANGNAGLMTGANAYNEVRPDQDGIFVKNAYTAGKNLLALDTEMSGIKTRLDDAVIYDGVNHAKATLTGGTVGTTLDNVKAGLVSKNSKEAINGGQLWSVKQDIEGFAADIERNTNSIQTLNGSVSNALASVAAANTLVNTVNDLKADASLNNLSAAGKQVISNAAIDAVQQYMASQNADANTSSLNTSNKTMMTNKRVDGLSLSLMSSPGADANYVVYDDADASQITLEDSTGEGTKITNLAEGSLSAASTDAVNGSQLYKTNRDIAAMQETLSTNNGTVAALQTDTQTLKTNMITLQSQYATTKTQVETGFNVTVDGAKVKTVNPDSAYMDFVTGDHTEIVNDNGSVRVNVRVDGQVADGNTGLVSGGMVAGETRVAGNGNYILENNSAAQNLSVLDTMLKETRDLAEAAAASGEDANAVHYDVVDHSSITLGGAEGTLITNLQDGLLSADSTDAVTGKQLFATNERLDALDVLVGTVDDGNYVSADKSMGENINVLDGQLKTVSDGLDTVRSDVAVLRMDVDDLNDKVTGFEVELDGKADTDFGNLTDTGKTVISDIARESVKVKGAGLAKVTSAENGNTTVYTVNVQADGKVEENNTGLVNGGTVYNSINMVCDEFAEDLAGKADLDLSNISDGGKTVIREVMKEDLAKKADKSDLAKKANVDASNINVDAWATKLGTGEVSEGNTGLVNGGTVYDAIQQVGRNNNIVEIKDDVIYMGAREGGNVISIYNNEGQGRVITGVITDPEDPTSAANVGYVNAVGDSIIKGVNREFNRMDDKISEVGANAAAMASLTPGGLDGDEKFGLAAAVGNYRNATAGAVGLFYKPQNNVVMNARASFGTHDNMLGAGVYVGLNKGNTPGVTKATLMRAVNAQAAKITEQDAVIAELKDQVAFMMQQMAVQSVAGSN